MRIQCAVLLLAFATLTVAADDLATELKELPHRILYESYVGNNWELMVMNADGSAKTNLTQTEAIHEHYPQASPDGKNICFLADTGAGRDTLRHIYYMPAAGGERVLSADAVTVNCCRKRTQLTAVSRIEEEEGEQEDPL